MKTAAHTHTPLNSEQLSTKTWPDFQKLFARHRGVWGGCWCMYFHAQGGFDPGDYEGNRKAKRALVREGRAHGTMVYCGGEPVGWCQFGPREELPRIDRKRGYAQSGDGAWRITCLFVAKDHRRMGVARAAILESVRAMKRMGVEQVEAFPVSGQRVAAFLWSGTPELFKAAGFREAGKLGRSGWIYKATLRRSHVSY